MKVGDVVIYHDEVGRAHNAILTSAWEGAENPSVNLVYVSSDSSKQDAWGRQTERASSVIHASNSTVHGRYWRRENEAVRPYVPPASS